MNKMTKLIEKWATDRNLHNAEPSKQMLKLMEEVGELSKAVGKDDVLQIVDGIGDIVVVLTILALQYKIKIDFCVETAYEEIKNRKGKVVNGIFVKEGGK